MPRTMRSMSSSASQISSISENSSGRMRTLMAHQRWTRCWEQESACIQVSLSWIWCLKALVSAPSSITSSWVMSWSACSCRKKIYVWITWLRDMPSTSKPSSPILKRAPHEPSHLGSNHETPKTALLIPGFLLRTFCCKRRCRTSHSPSFSLPSPFSSFNHPFPKPYATDLYTPTPPPHVLKPTT